MKCNQVCMYNFSDAGCLKPEWADCPMSMSRKPDVITNADRIRAMTDEELAVQLEAFCETSECRAENGAVCPLIHDCPMDKIGVSWLDWLKQPYGGADHE